MKRRSEGREGPAHRSIDVRQQRAEERCELCHGPLYRVSLIDGTLERLDHRECALLSQAA